MKKILAAIGIAAAISGCATSQTVEQKVERVLDGQPAVFYNGGEAITIENYIPVEVVGRSRTVINGYPVETDITRAMEPIQIVKIDEEIVRQDIYTKEHIDEQERVWNYKDIEIDDTLGRFSYPEEAHRGPILTFVTTVEQNHLEWRNNYLILSQEGTAIYNGRIGYAEETKEDRWIVHTDSGETLSVINIEGNSDYVHKILSAEPNKGETREALDQFLEQGWCALYLGEKRILIEKDLWSDLDDAIQVRFDDQTYKGIHGPIPGEYTLIPRRDTETPTYTLDMNEGFLQYSHEEAAENLGCTIGENSEILAINDQEIWVSTLAGIDEDSTIYNEFTKEGIHFRRDECGNTGFYLYGRNNTN